MLKHNVIELFRKFTQDDIKKFDKFLRSPYFNSSSKMISLYQEIIKYYPDFNDSGFTKNSVSLNSSNSGTFNESTLRDSLSELLKLALKYLSVANFESKGFDTKNYMLEELLRRNLPKLFRKRVLGLTESMDEQSCIDSGYLYNMYWFDTMVYNFEEETSKILHKTDAEEKINKLGKISLDLLKFYISEIISLHLNSYLTARKYNLKYEEFPLSKHMSDLNVTSVLRNYSNDDSMIIQLYKYLLDTFNNFEKEQFYKRYKIYVENNKHLLSENEIRFHYNWLVNYCISKKILPSKEIDFDVELFNLYNYILENGYYKDKKHSYLSAPLYRDILIHGLQLFEYRWTENFIQKYCYEVKPEEKDNIYNFSYAYYNCATGDYAKAFDFYQKLKIGDFIYKYDVKVIALKLYFELGYFEEGLAEIRNFREFLRNNQLVTQRRKTRYGNYLRYFEKLIFYRYDSASDKIDLDYLKKKITEDKNVFDKNWLLSKINSIISGYKHKAII